MAAPVFRLGDQGFAIEEIRRVLDKLGCHQPDSAVADDVFDESLEESVRQFQQERGLIADGLVGPLTYRALEEARWHLGDRLLRYQPGHLLTGDDVMALQRKLFELGFDLGRVDGEFGPLTQSALRDFQRNMGLSPDGVAGPATLKEIKQLSLRVTGGRPDALRAIEARRRAGPRLSGKVVVIDPFSEPDAEDLVVEGISAAEVVLDLVNRIEGRLSLSGVQVYQTRGSGSKALLDIPARARLANDVQADVFISLFLDRHDNPKASGVAAYYYGRDEDTSSAEGEHLASLLQKEIVARTDLVDCRCHPKTWDLLRRTQMPAVLLSLGYLTNPGDRRRLANPAFRDTLAEAVAAALQRVYLPEEFDEDTGALNLMSINELLARQS